jgi:hypothetical protein
MADELTRQERLLAMVLLALMRDADQGARAVALSRAGLHHPEIAELLDAKANVVKQQVYEARKKKTAKPAGKKSVRSTAKKPTKRVAKKRRS